MDINGKILVTGSDGMVGTALINKLKERGYHNLLLPAFKELDLRNQKDVENFFEKNRPEYIFHIAAKVVGIAANIASPA